MRKGNVGAAIILIVIGVWFLAVELFPQVKEIAYRSDFWPVPIVGVGALLALVGLVTWTPGMMIPAVIVSGIGALLFYQNQSGDWESWAYAWALIPGFVGLGMVLSGVMGRAGGSITVGAWMLLISLIVFAVFAGFLGGASFFGRFWPLALILLGLIVLGRGMFRRRKE